VQAEADAVAKLSALWLVLVVTRITKPTQHMATFGERIAHFFSGNDELTHEGLHGLFVTELQNVYYAETKAVDALGNQAEAATTDAVKQAFRHHQEETRNQVSRLEQIFQILGLEAKEGFCAAIDGLADDAQAMISATESGSLTRDAGLIVAAQKVEHHEIAIYGSLVTFAKVLGYAQSASLLQQTLDEEGNTDHKLTRLAESFINTRAELETEEYDDVKRNTYRPMAVEATAGGTLGI